MDNRFRRGVVAGWPRRVSLGLSAVMLSTFAWVGGSAPAEAKDAVLVGAGDIASCGSAGDTLTARLLDRTPGTVFTLGDNAYNAGAIEEYRRCYGPTWGRHRGRTQPAVGNHEYGRQLAAGHSRYYGWRAGAYGRYYYSYGRGSWHIIVLNSNCARVSCATGSPQERWLRAQLKANRNKCVLAMWHHPRWSSSTGASRAVQPLWRALAVHRADVVLWGHSHHYERFAPMNAFGKRRPWGIRSFIVGTGGANLIGIRPAALARNSVVRNGRTWGVLKLSLGAGMYRWKFMPVAGKTFTDAGAGACH